MALHLYSTIHPNKTKRFTNINELSHSVFKGIHIQFEVWCDSDLKNTSDIFIASFLGRHSPMKHHKYPCSKAFLYSMTHATLLLSGRKMTWEVYNHVYKYLHSNNGMTENYSILNWQNEGMVYISKKKHV